MVPVLELPPCTPFTCQIMLVVVVPVTVAENCFVPPGATVAEVGEMATEMTEEEELIVTVALAEKLEFAALVAVTVTDPPEGTDAGAV